MIPRTPQVILLLCVPLAFAFEKLLFVETYFRHGDRTPVQPIKTTPFNASFYGNQLGELTPLGMKQGNLLGKLMKKRYVLSFQLLDENNLNQKEIYIRSTDVNRTLVTAYAFVSGMFDYGKRGRDFPDIPGWIPNWTPIPVHTSAMATDYEGNPFPMCARANELEAAQFQTPLFRNLVTTHEEFCESLEKFTGDKVSTKESISVYGLLDALMILKRHNQTLPEWATPALIARLNTISDEQLMFKFGQTGSVGDDLIRLRGGSKMKIVLSRLQNKWNCFATKNASRTCHWYSKLKFHAFATHDMTLWSLLTPFGVVEKVFGKHHEIDHAASLTFELWNVDGKPMINVVFLKNPNGSEDFQSITHLVAGCPQDRKLCSFETVLDAVKRFFPKDLGDECKSKTSRSKRFVGPTEYRDFYDGFGW